MSEERTRTESYLSRPKSKPSEPRPSGPPKGGKAVAGSITFNRAPSRTKCPNFSIGDLRAGPGSKLSNYLFRLGKD
jgi:hypothetical protein